MSLESLERVIAIEEKLDKLSEEVHSDLEAAMLSISALTS